MIVTIDNNLTVYEFGKHRLVKIRKIFKDNKDVYIFEYGLCNRLFPDFSVWDYELPKLYASYVHLAFNFIGFSRNINETEIRSIVSSIRNFLNRRLNEKDK